MLELERIDAHAARVLETGVAPAVAFALTDGDQTLAAWTYGAAAPDALWPIASIGKTFAAVVALQLAEEGVLDRLGLASSVPVMVHDTRRRLPVGHAPFYDDRPWHRDHGLAVAPSVESAEADGCSCRTPEDLAAFVRAIWSGRALLEDASLATMKSPQPPHEEHPYGL